MKKILLFAGVLTLTSAVNAQTINDSNLVEFGDTIFNAIDNSPSISLGTTGTGNNWNFSGLLTNSVDTVVFYHPGQVAGNAATTTFPTASLASKEDTNYIFLEKNSASLQLLGLSNGTIHVASENYETIITFPSSFGTTFLDTAKTQTVVSGATAGYPSVDSVRVVSTTYINSNFDASGSLTTPFGVFSCIRQYLIRATTDVVYAKISGFWNPSPIVTQNNTAYSHQYWSDAATAKFPLVSYDLTSAGALSGSVSWTKGLTVYNNTGTKELDKKTISIYPNPVQNTLNIDNQDAINSVSIMDITGKVVYRTENQNKKTLNVDFLNKGIYILSVETDTYIGTTKFIKQ
ncbi:T9SS type A sorting domain-containing protein [Flavobacteriales bacterium]|nr:T9SS type A sorting domain-containing protein [Flavobacteriales bacterium]